MKKGQNRNVHFWKMEIFYRKGGQNFPCLTGKLLFQKISEKNCDGNFYICFCGKGLGDFSVDNLGNGCQRKNLQKYLRSMNVNRVTMYALRIVNGQSIY
jgi:hypothetical protein